MLSETDADCKVVFEDSLSNEDNLFPVRHFDFVPDLEQDLAASDWSLNLACNVSVSSSTTD